MKTIQTELTPDQIYNKLYELTSKHVKNYIEDLTTHDKRSINKYPGTPFIHIAREHGTSLTRLFISKFYPKEGEKVKYMFGGHADRKQLLKSNFEYLGYYLENSPKSIYFFNGQIFKKVTKQQAEDIYKKYMDNLISKWEEEEDRHNLEVQNY
jgi:ribosomal protein S17E